MKNRDRLIVAGALLLWSLAAALGTAKPIWVKKARDLGFPAENCLYCHTVMTPAKDRVQEQLNDRGKWLVAEKERRAAKEVDLIWLKEYESGKNKK